MKLQLLLILLILSSSGMAQLGSKYFGEGGDDVIAEMISSEDGNFFAIGSKTEEIQKIWLLKIDSLGNLIWEKTFPLANPAYSEIGFSINAISNGDMLITGMQVNDDDFKPEASLVMKVNAQGNMVWKKIYEDISCLYDAKVSGGKIIMGGWYDVTGSSDSGILLITNPEGGVLLRKEIKIYNQNFVKRVMPLADGNFILAGRANVIGVGFGGIFLQKINPDGDEIWTTKHDLDFREDDFDPSTNISPNPLGIYIDVNDTIWVTHPKAYSTDIAVLKFSPNGSLANERSYGKPEWREHPYAIIPSGNSGFIIAGSTAEGASFAMHINRNGNESWRVNYSQSNAILNANDIDVAGNHFLLSGQYKNLLDSFPNDDGWILGIEKDGNQFPFTIRGTVYLDENRNCQVDPGESPITGWFIDINSTEVKETRKYVLITDDAGRFETHVGASSNLILIYNQDSVKWNLCSESALISIDHDHPEDSVVFLVQPTLECISPEVYLTQPDLIRCDTSCLLATVKNDASYPSVPLVLSVVSDHGLHLSGCSRPYTINGNEMIVELESIEKYNSVNTEICYSLDCNVQLGATHVIKAWVTPKTCESLYTGPQFAVESFCDGEVVMFQMENTGGGGTNVMTTYSVYVNGVIMFDHQGIRLDEGAGSQEIFLPADGRTWLVEINQWPDHPHPYPASAIMEDCGKGSNGLHSIGFLNGSRADDMEPGVCIVRAQNSIGKRNMISPATHGYGFYNLISDTERMEYSILVTNEFPFTASEFSLDLTINQNLDITSFLLLSSPGAEIISLPDSSAIRIKYEDLVIQPGQQVMIRFSLKPRPGLLPDDGSNSVFTVEGSAFFNELGPVLLETGFYNYSETVPAPVDSYNQYDKEIKLFGGRNYDFGNRLAKGKDGSIFACGESNSFGLRGYYDGFILKLNPNGEAIWEAAIDADSLGSNSINGIGPLPDGGCLVSGNFRAQGLESYVENTKLFVARLDSHGKILWVKHLSLPPNVPGAWTYGLLESSDENFLLYGVARNEGSDQFYMKINPDGDILWSRFPSINGSYFKPTEGVALSDGNFVFVGNNESTVIDVDVYAEKLSATGEILWSMEYQSENGIYLGDIAQVGHSEFMIAGFSQWVLSDTQYVLTPTFIKVNAEGDVVWEKNPVIGPFDIAFVNCIASSQDHGLYVGGDILADTNNQFTDMLLMRVNEEGEIEWYKNYGSANSESAYDVLVYADDNIMAWGHNQQRPPFYDLQSMLVRTNRLGEWVATEEPAIIKSLYSSFVFPNPAGEYTTLVLSPEPTHQVTYVISDVSGRVLLTSQEDRLPGIQIDLHTLQSGIYFISFPGTDYPGQRIVVIQ